MDNPVLVIQVIEARNITAMDKGGTSDPYCCLTCSFNKQKFKTQVIFKTISPKWDETFKFFAPPDATGLLSIKIWDKARWTMDASLGDIQLDISRFADGKIQDLWVFLENEPKKKEGIAKGEVHIIVSYHKSFEGGLPPLRKKLLKSATPKAVICALRNSGSHNKTEVLEDKYEIGKEIGRGSFAIVKKGTNKKTGQEVAIKCINKEKIKKEELEFLSREINIMQKLRHKNIIQLIDVFNTPYELFFVLELVSGGELFDQIVSRGSFSESDAANLVRQVLEGVDYMHKRGVAHRDLKPENLLCTAANVIKIADFGLAKEEESGNFRTSCGTPNYVGMYEPIPTFSK